MISLVRLVAVGVFFGLSTIGAHAMDQIPAPGMTSAAIDPTLFRDGEVRRRNERFGAWSLDCDEIPRLGQRFCSLRALAVDAQGVGVARMTISTDERGRPAAVLDLPLGVDLSRSIEISPDGGLVMSSPSAALLPTARRLVKQTRGGADGRAAQVRTEILQAKLRTHVCDAAGCHAFWGLTPADIAALRAGAGLQIAYAMQVARISPTASPSELTRNIRKGIIVSQGFGDAVSASLR